MSMPLTRRIVEIKADWLRVPLWSLYFPLYLIPDFIISALCCATGRARIVQAECWQNMLAIYISGIDGWANE